MACVRQLTYTQMTVLFESHYAPPYLSSLTTTPLSTLFAVSPTHKMMTHI